MMDAMMEAMMEKELDDSQASVPLRSNDRKDTGIIVTVGNTPRQVDVQFTNICISVREKKGKTKEILRGVTGEFRSGRLTAILGPSGAGKTTLLDILASRGARSSRRKVHLDGLRLNGVSCCERPELLRRLSVCYIPQDFALMPFLTTKETIHVAATLKLPGKSYDPGTRKFVMNDVARRLGLQDCMDTLTSKLSGGERKRLSIAVEMLTSPSVMLLDEPTSGLDSTSSNQVIGLLGSMARTGCTVVCAVHQPSSQITCRFDDVLVISQGRSRYCGPRDNLLDYFKQAGYICPPFYNLSEFVLEVVTGQRDGDYELLCNKSSMEGIDWESKCSNSLSSDFHGDSSVSKRYAVSFWTQQKILLRRAFISIMRDKTMTNLRLSAHLLVAILLGIVFYNFGQDASRVQSNIACLFFFIIFLFFANSMPSVQMFPPEATVFLRENTNNWYSLEAYYLTKVLADLPMQIICPTGFLAIAYYLTGQPIEVMRFTQVWLICTLFTIMAQSMGIVTGAAFNTHAGMFLVPAFNIPMFLFAGFFLKLGEIPLFLQFFSVISYFRYAFEGVLQAVYMGRGKLPCPADFCYLRSPDRILGDLDMPSVPFSTTVFALVSWIVILHSLIYGVLRWKLYVFRT